MPLQERFLTKPNRSRFDWQEDESLLGHQLEATKCEILNVEKQQVTIKQQALKRAVFLCS